MSLMQNNPRRGCHINSLGRKPVDHIVPSSFESAQRTAQKDPSRVLQIGCVAFLRGLHFQIFFIYGLKPEAIDVSSAARTVQ